MKSIHIIDVFRTQPTEQDLKLKFLNTVLEPYTEYIYSFWISEPFMKMADNCHDSFRSSIIEYLKECLELAKCIRQTRSREIIGRGWKIRNGYDANILVSKIELYFLEKLEGYETIFYRNLPEDIDKISTARNWSLALKSFPRLKNLPIDLSNYHKAKNEWHSTPHYFDTELITAIIANLEECIAVAKTFTIEQDISVSTRFIAFMLDNGVPRTREAYRELYKVLDLYGCISDDIKKSHEKTTSVDPQSNYVKSIAMNALQKLDLIK